MRKTYLILGIIFLLFILGILAFFRFLKPTSKIIQPGFCKILEEKYCSKAEWVYYESKDKRYKYIGINLPPDVRVPVYAAAKGHFDISIESGAFYGKGVNVETTDMIFVLRGNIDTSKWGKLTGADVTAGTILGYAQASPNKSLGKYDLVFTIGGTDSIGSVVAEEKLRNLFK